MYIDHINENTGAATRFCLNADHADTAGSASKLDCGNVGNRTTPVYFANGVPQTCEQIKTETLTVNVNGTNAGSFDGSQPVTINIDTISEEDVNDLLENYLPLSAGPEKKLTGPLGLPEGIMYGTTLPTTGFDGQLFFLAEDAEDPPLYVPEGGSTGDVLIKNSAVSGDYEWKKLDTLPEGGSKGQVLIKNSSTDGDASWITQGLALTGDVSGSGLFDSVGNLTITTTVADNSHNHTNLQPIKRCIVGQTSSTTTNPWYQVGLCKINSANSDRSITFKVSQGYGDNATYTGILTCHVRTGNPNAYSSGQLIWEYANGGVVLTDWILGYKNNNDSTVEISIWANQDSGWALFHLEVLSEHDRTDWTTDWTLYTTKSAGSQASIPSEWTQVTSTYANIYGAKVYGAVWNDYAEYRNQKEKIEPGYCVYSNNQGILRKTQLRLEACDGIVSDTFGFAIGETKECKTPLAVAGRVLAYCEGNRYDYQSGDAVCAGPDGKVCKMSREEIREWPDRIIGTVSEIPEYKHWGDGNIPVNNRIWIKVK